MSASMVIGQFLVTHSRAVIHLCSCIQPKGVKTVQAIGRIVLCFLMTWGALAQIEDGVLPG